MIVSYYIYWFEDLWGSVICKWEWGYVTTFSGLWGLHGILETDHLARCMAHTQRGFSGLWAFPSLLPHIQGPNFLSHGECQETPDRVVPLTVNCSSTNAASMCPSVWKIALSDKHFHPISCNKNTMLTWIKLILRGEDYTRTGFLLHSILGKAWPCWLSNMLGQRGMQGSGQWCVLSHLPPIPSFQARLYLNQHTQCVVLCPGKSQPHIPLPTHSPNISWV